MIEKLSEYEITKRDGDYINADNNTKIINTLVCKINELVDAVNFIMEEFPEQTHALSMAIKHNTEELEKYASCQHEPYDYIGVRPSMAQVSNQESEYEEHQKWIGKACWMWNIPADRTLAVLAKVIPFETGALNHEADTGLKYCHCQLAQVEKVDNLYTKTCRMEKEFAEEELERTKKKLDIAVEVLKQIDDTRSAVKENLYASYGKSLNSGNVFCWTTPDEIHNALEQINQKEQQ